jgi:hypothetical protein
MATSEKSRTRDVGIALREIAELVVVPEFDPLGGQFETRSGVERILDHLRSVDGANKVDALRASIALERQPSPDELARVRTALAGLCAQRDRELAEQTVTVRRDGTRALGKGLIFMLICMLISALAREASFLHEIVSSLISEGFVIAGWVALWHPTELLLYEWWPISRDRQLYRLVSQMEIAIAAPTAKPVVNPAA